MTDAGLDSHRLYLSLLIDEQKIGNPFTIKAIGNSDKIYNSIMREKGYISTLTNDGIKVDVKTANSDELYVFGPLKEYL